GGGGPHRPVLQAPRWSVGPLLLLVGLDSAVFRRWWFGPGDEFSAVDLGCRSAAAARWQLCQHRTGGYHSGSRFPLSELFWARWFRQLSLFIDYAGPQSCG